MTSASPPPTLPRALRTVAFELGRLRALLVAYELQLLPLVGGLAEAEDEENVALVVLGMIQVIEREILLQAIEGLEEAAHLAEGTAAHEFP